MTTRLRCLLYLLFYVLAPLSMQGQNTPMPYVFDKYSPDTSTDTKVMSVKDNLNYYEQHIKRFEAARSPSAFLRMIQNSEGDLVAIGYRSKKNKNIRFFKCTTDGKVLVDTLIRNDSKSIVKSICQTPDGGYIIVGAIDTFIAKNRVKKRVAYAFKVYEQGGQVTQPIWTFIDKDASESIYNDVVANDDGSIWLTGQKDTKGFLWKAEEEEVGIDGSTQLKTKGSSEILNDTDSLKLNAYSGMALVKYPLTEEEEDKVAVTGFGESPNGENILFAKSFRFTHDKIEPIGKIRSKKNAIGRDIIIDNSGNVVVVGERWTPQSINDMWVMRFTPQGDSLYDGTMKRLNPNPKEKKQTTAFGEDAAHAIAQDFAGNYYIVGYTKAFPRGTRRKMFFIFITDSTLEKRKRSFSEDRLQNNYANDILITADGRIMIAGIQERVAWIANWDAKTRPDSTKTIQNLSIEPLDNKDNFTFENYTDSVFRTFKLRNTSIAPIHNLIVTLKSDSVMLFDNQKYVIGRLRAGEVRTIQFKIKFTTTQKDLSRDNQILFTVTGTSNEKELKADTVRFVGKYRSSRPPIIVAKDDFLVSIDSKLAKKGLFSLFLMLRNDAEGKGLVEGRLDIDAPFNIQTQYRSRYIKIHESDSLLIRIDCQKEKDYDGIDKTIRIFFKDNDGNPLLDTAYIIPFHRQ